MKARLLAAWAVAVLLGPAAPALAGEPAHFEPIDVFQLEYASDPRISPDGKTVVYVRNFMDIMKDRRRSNLWIVGYDGSRHRPLTTGKRNDKAPRWSPDGTRVLYVSSEDGSSQLYLRWMDTGQTAKLSNLTSPPGGIAWSPDGRWIAFSMRVREQVKPLADMPPKPEGAEWAKPAKVIQKLNYRLDGAGYLKDGYTQLFVLPADGGTPRQLTTGEFHHRGPPSWTPDGEALVFSANRHDDWEYDPLNSEVYEVSVVDGSIKALTGRAGPDASPVVSPDGKRIAYVGFDDRQQGYQVRGLYVMNRDGGGAALLTGSLDRSVRQPAWGRDGKGVYFLYDDRGNTYIGYTSLGGKVRTVAGGVGGTSIGRPYAGGSFSVAAGGRFACTHARPDTPADVAVGRRGSRQARRITDLNQDLFGHKELGAVEEIWYESSFDGRKVQGWVVKPPGFDTNKKYPLILEIHGGPFSNYGARFAAEIQLYAAAGYVVLYANPRGSTSYGEEFGNLIHHNYPGEDYDDLMSGVDAVIGRGYIDANNLFVTGGSGGGVLSSWIVGKTDRFRAAVVAKPVINWYSFALTSDVYSFFYKYWFPGFPWDHPQHYLERSPISLVGNVTTPTMLLTGENDYRTPISESEQFYQALKLRHIDTALVRIPGASHGIARRPSRLIAKVAHILKWFETYRTENNLTKRGE
ncbi:MAG: prolyl oligopeptidase family serine peptidase [Candidatus Krumholzibacteriia bacterium]